MGVVVVVVVVRYHIAFSMTTITAGPGSVVTDKMLKERCRGL